MCPYYRCFQAFMAHFAKLSLQLGLSLFHSQLIQPPTPPPQHHNHQYEFNSAPMEQYPQSKIHLSLSLGPN